jgi:hypothetical protein
MVASRAFPLFWGVLLATALAWGSDSEPSLGVGGAGPQALRWQQPLLWHYNPQNEPQWLEPGEGLALFTEAARLWEPCGVQIDYAGVSALPAGTMDNQNVMGWRAFKQPQLRGLTVRRQVLGNLAEADVMISASNPQLINRRLLRKVILHEFGHALGLIHSPDCTSVMSSATECFRPTFLLPQQPVQSDWEQCKIRYEK